jgi:hypothetical protein
LQRLGEQMHLKASEFEEDCKRLRIQLHNSQQEHYQSTQSHQQCQEEGHRSRLESLEQIASLHTKIQMMQDAAALEASASTLQLRDIRLVCEIQQKDLALIRQERATIEAELKQKLFEKDEVTT